MTMRRTPQDDDVVTCELLYVVNDRMPRAEPFEALVARAWPEFRAGGDEALEFLRQQAHRDEPLRNIFERLRRHDDADSPLCSDTPGATPVVYRRVRERWADYEHLTDGAFRFTHLFVYHFALVAKQRPTPQLSDRVRRVGIDSYARVLIRVVDWEQIER